MFGHSSDGASTRRLSLDWRAEPDIERGAEEIRSHYTQMRKQLLTLIDELRERAE